MFRMRDMFRLRSMFRLRGMFRLRCERLDIAHVGLAAESLCQPYTMSCLADVIDVADVLVAAFGCRICRSMVRRQSHSCL